MISLYIHIPFCSSKCAYCSFTSFPITQFDDYPLTTQRTSELRIENYIISLKKEIDYYAEKLEDKEIKTLYFGGGTPSRIGVERIIDIIEYLRSKFNIENIAELSIELNPNPMDEVLHFVDTINTTYKDFPRVRFSFGIQSLDDEVLQMTGRSYNFAQIAEFLRELVKHKKEHTVFNFDFIAFGKFQVSKLGNKQLRHEFKRDFFQKFLASGYVDSVSLYTLEGISYFDSAKAEEKSYPKGGDFSPMLEMKCTTPTYYGTDDDIMEEFHILKQFIEDAGFMRYEISNFATASKVSIHNMAYWTMEPYLGLGLSASSFFPCHSEAELKNIVDTLYPSLLSGGQAMRRTNTTNMQDYLEGKRVNEKEVQSLNESDLLIEEFFLRLRTRDGIADISKFTSVLIKEYELRITNYQEEGLVSFDGKKLQLTDTGMNVYNSIVTELLEKL